MKTADAKQAGGNGRQEKFKTCVMGFGNISGKVS